MSGYQANLMSDNCFRKQQAEFSTTLFNERDFQRYVYENFAGSNLLSTCNGKYAHVQFKSCNSNDGTMTHTLDNLKYRIEVENDLKGIDRYNTKCDTNKFKPCYVNNCSTKTNGCSNIKIINQPLLCDRSIVQTNMQPFKSGFIHNNNKLQCNCANCKQQ